MAEEDDVSRFIKRKKIHVEVGTPLQLQIAGITPQLKTTLVGIKPEEYFIIHTPKFEGIESKLYAGNNVIVRFIFSGTVYGFISTILNYVYSPSRLIFLSYPDLIEMQELRDGFRVECYLPARAKLPGHDTDYAGIVMDISSGGCNLSLITTEEFHRNPVRVGETIQISIQLLGLEGFQMFSGEVRMVRQDQKKMTIGLKFDGNNAPDKLEKIDEYVKKVIEFL